MDFRMYDNAIGKFYGMDALSEKNHYLSPFQFADGNPVYYSDPSGLTALKNEAHFDSDIRTGNEEMTRTALIGNYGLDFGGGGGGAGRYGSGDVVGGTMQDLLNSIYKEMDRLGVNKITYTNNGNGSFSYSYWKQYNFEQVGSTSSSYSNWDEVTVGVKKYTETVSVGNGSSGIDFDYTGHAINFGGGILGVLEGLSASNGYWLGNNGKYYSTSWGGNRYTGSRSGALLAARNFKLAGKGLTIIEVGIGIYATREGYKKDGGKFGYNAQHAAASTATGIALGIAGAKVGATIGASIGVWFGGVGAIPGTVIGGVIGGFVMGVGGSYLGGYLGGSGVDYIHGK
jgi:hypothetical protein